MRIDEVLEHCSVVVVIVGPNWLTTKDSTGRNRLDLEDDLVRIEVGNALRHEGVMVVPLLVGNASMPEASALPAELEDLSRRNAVRLQDASWDSDVKALGQQFGKRIGHPKRPRDIVIAATIGTGVAAYVGAELASGLFSVQDQPSNLAVAMNEFLTFLFPGAALAAISVFAQRSKFPLVTAIAVGALIGGIATSATTLILRIPTLAVDEAYLPLLCLIRGIAMGLCATLFTSSLSAVLRGALAGGAVGLIWGATEPQILVASYFGQRFVPLAVIGAAVSIAIIGARQYLRRPDLARLQ